jgi:hypothetical protein
VLLFERVGERGQSQPEWLNADVGHFQELEETQAVLWVGRGVSVRERGGVFVDRA